MPPVYSKLSQPVTRDGQTVDVYIFQESKSGWTLEVENEEGTSVVWDDTFPTDQAAWNEVQQVLDADGIASLFAEPDQS